MDMRKIYLSGGSTYVVSLPKKWVIRQHLTQGDSLIVSEERDTLMLSPNLKTRPPLAKTVRCSSFPSASLFEKHLIAYYLAGYDILTLKLDVDNNSHFRDVAWETAQRLIGVEIIEDTLGALSMETLLDPERMPITKTVRKLNSMCQSMMRDTLTIFECANAELAAGMGTRENEIDRLYFLAIRQLKEATRSDQLAKKLEIRHSNDALECRVVVQHIERISDHIESISKNVLGLIEMEPEHELEEFVDASRLIFSLYEQAVSPIILRDYSVPVGVFEMEAELDEMLLHRLKALMDTKSSGRDALLRRGILSSLDRIKSYTMGIAEMAINLNVSEVEESM